jgi:glutamine amidotransferase
MKVAVVKYNAGNTRSLGFALERLGVDYHITDDKEALRTADKVIFPGQGEASSAMTYLRDRHMDLLIRELKQPFLGVCLGMQLMCNHSEENNTIGLGIIDAEVKRFDASQKVPHMGWNTIHRMNGPLFEDIKDESYMYFVHSYYVESCEHTVATSHYGVDFSVSVQKDNFYAIQPHPEKSAETGMQLLENFLKI